ncbi:MAG: DUF805 domain-containing protein [Bdellovibrio sp.]|nr:DUF805 domain-containing protein [Methylotenera sp.]
MNFMDAVKTCFAKYADFNGRAGLPEYWWFFLFVIVASIILSGVSGLLANIFSLATFVPFIAVTARRLHDTNKSGWLQLWWTIAGTLGIVLTIYGFVSVFFPGGLAGTGSAAIGGLGALVMLASFGLSIYFMVQKSDYADNQYGAPPAN